MCCFSGTVTRVESTRIFARRSASGRQVLAYQMKLAATADVAMILPLPVPKGTGDNAVRFISLEGYPTLFADMEKSFPIYLSLAPARLGPVSGGMLEVVKVGKFVASFVPGLADFARLDPQFRVPPNTLNRIREYATYGFAVFQLAVTKGALTEIHPMAFEFPTRHSDKLFFPTVHVHAGALPKTARFAHQLYAQGINVAQGTGWESGEALGGFVDATRAQGLINPDDHAFKLSLFGTLPNEDQWAALG